jgi:hypothetical protein
VAARYLGRSQNFAPVDEVCWPRLLIAGPRFLPCRRGLHA